jgi:hypothetical protein
VIVLKKVAILFILYSLASFANAETLPEMMVNFSNSYAQIWSAIKMITTTMGLVMIIGGILSIPKVMDGKGQTTMKTPIWTIICGVLLYQITPTMNMLADTMAMCGAGCNDTTILTASSAGSGTIGKWSATVIVSVLGFVQLLGLIAVVRGILILKALQTGEAREGMGRAITHMLGGAAAIHIKWTVGIFAATFAPNMTGILRQVGAMN